MMACPYGIPRYEWDSNAPLVRKCNLCYERLSAGELPACVQACPEHALTFGERDELLELAHRRISESAGRYLPTVYGEAEAGGTSVMYLSDFPLDFLYFHDAPGDEPLPALTWNWLSKVPGLALTTAGLMGGLFWIIGRRMQAEELRALKQADKTEASG
jgi:formate dehydrogenase iron-sulfur subunit